VVDCTVGIEKLNESTISIFPNPASSTFTIDMKTNALGVQIYNANATLVLEEKYIADTNNSSTKTLYLSNFSKGVYFVKVITTKGVALKKLIIE
jgi:hypothetical protein